MAKFIVNNPKDLLVLRVDGTIDHTPTGKGFKSRYIITSGDKKEVVYRADDAGLDLCYISVEELTPSNEPALRRKLTDAFLDSPQKDEIAGGIAEYFRQFGRLAVNAAILGETYKLSSDDKATKSLLEDGIKHFVFHGRDYIAPKQHEKESVPAHAVAEMKRLFPQAQHLADAIKPDKDYPFIAVDKEKLKKYLGPRIPKEKQVDAFVDKAIAALREECTSTKLSAPSKRLVDKVKKFPSQIKDKRLKPLFELPFADDTLTIQLSPGAFVSDWEPALNRISIGGSYLIDTNTITIPAKGIEEGLYNPSEILGRPLPSYYAYLPHIDINCDLPLTLRKIYFEEMFHYAMQAVFKNICQPYGKDDAAGKKAHIDAIIADVMPEGEKPNMDLVKKLGLESYMDDTISFRQHLEEGVRSGSHKNMGAEVIAKVADLIETEGWNATRATLPHLCDDFENRILPRCYEVCKSHGIEVPGADAGEGSHQGKIKKTGWKRS